MARTWRDYMICKAMHWTYNELAEQPADVVDVFHAFAAGEEEAIHMQSNPQ